VKAEELSRGRIDKRQAILDAAFRVFAEQGYDQASVDAIAARAGVAKATIYNHFGDKETVLRELIVVEADRALAEHLAIVEGLSGTGADLRTTLEDVGYRLLERYFDEQTVLYRRLLAGEITRFPDLLEVVRGRAADRIMDAIADRLARLALAGRLRITDPALAADQFWALLAGPTEARSAMGTRRIPESELRTASTAAVDTFLRAFGEQSTGRSGRS
jgi:TetR/AcrR family transcriptional regulator, mexJK operon transcriptional repressor